MTSPSNDAPKRGPSNWIPQTWTSPAVKVASTARRILIPAFAAAVLMSGAMLACGSDASEGPSSTPDTKQPTVVATTQQDQDGNQPDSRDADRDRNGQQPSGDSDQPTDTPRPTPEPSPTDTPEPTPEPTMVPTPTPDPMRSMVLLLRGFWDSETNREFYDFSSYNEELIRHALSESLADFLTEEYPEIATYSRSTLLDIAYYSISFPDERHGDAVRVQIFERVPSDDGKLLIKINFHFYVDALGSTYRHEATMNGVVDIVSPPYRNTGFPQPRELEAVTDQVPVFSHLVGELVVGPAQKE